MKREIACAHCGNPSQQETGLINRAARKGAPIFCGRICSGLARREWKPDQQRKAEKAKYDRAYREEKRDLLKAKRAAHFRATYDPVKAAVDRKKTMPRHVEYCRRPEYKVKKREYDLKYRAENEFGEYAEAYIILSDIEREIDSRASRYEIYSANGTLNKALNRRKQYDKSYSG